MKFRRYQVDWGIILSLALFLRVFGLGLNPIGLSHDDELHNLINAKSLAMTGTNVTGVVAGILTPNGRCLVGDCVYGELETYALVPWMRFFPLDIIWSKLPFVMASVGLVWVTGKLFENLSKKTSVGLLTGLMVAINPWAIYYGRTAYAYTFCFLFFILAAYFFTREKSHKSNLILGGVAAFMASLFYFGAKPILPLVVLWGVLYNLYQTKFRNVKFILIYFLVGSMVMAGYYYLLANSLAGQRIAEIGVSSIPIGERIKAFFGFFSPLSLFFSGQRVTDNYFMSGHGYFYAMEFPFLVLGVMAIIKSRSKAWLLFLLVAIAILPASIKTSGASIYSLRSALAYPLMCGVIGWGFYWVAKKYISNKEILLFVGISYLFSLSFFLFLYWHRLPREQATRWFFHERVVANYINRVRSKGDKKMVVLTARPDGIFNSFVFFGGIYNNEGSIKEVNRSYLSGSFEFMGTRFTNDCKDLTKQDLTKSIIVVDQLNKVDCGLDQKDSVKIANPKDAGGIFNILNDSLCIGYPTLRFPTPKSILDYNLKKLSDEAFCRLWITNPDKY